MYIVVQHTISNPTDFWSGAEQLMPKVPATAKLHHSFPTKDGKRAVCVWKLSRSNRCVLFSNPKSVA
jgi:hypothetical protein